MIRFFFRFWNSLGTSNFRSNFKKLAIANILAQILIVISAPILSRLFKPENFGELALYLSITSIITSIATLKFDWLIPNARSNRIAARLFMVGICILITSTLIFFVTILIIGDTVIPKEYLTLRKFAPFMALGVLGAGLHDLYTGWYVRISNLTNISKVKILSSASIIAMSILFGLTAFKDLGLLFAYIFGSWIGISLLFYGALELKFYLHNLRINQLKPIIKKYANQAFLSTAISALNVFSFRVTILLFAFIYSPYQIGLLIFGQQLINKPLQTIAQGLSKSFWAHVADLARHKEYRKLRKDFLKITYLLVGAAILLVLFIILIQPLIPILFGREWSEMGTILIMLIPMVFGSTIVSPTNHLIVLGQQALQLYADVIRLALICISIISAVFFELDFFYAVLSVSFSSLIGHLILFVIQLREQNKLISLNNK